MLKGISLEFASVPDPVPSSKWVNSSEKERINNINAAMQDFPGHEQMEIKSALTNGQLTLVNPRAAGSGIWMVKNILICLLWVSAPAY